MKNFELLTLSVVAATLVTMTGCSSDDDDSSSASGPSAPSEISTPVELNASAARNAMALVFRNQSIRPAPRRAHVPNNDRNTTQGNTEVRDCDIAGTETQSYTETTIDQGSAGESYRYSETTVYDNCIDNDVPPYDTRTRNGTKSYSEDDSYSAEDDLELSHWIENADYTDFRENNNSKISDKRTYTDYSSEENYSDDNTLEKETLTHNGTYTYVLTDADGKVIGGNRTIYGTYSFTSERVSSKMRKKSYNGFYSRYDTNSSGAEKLTQGTYYSNYVMHWYKPDTNKYKEEAVTVSGTVGDLCLGGSISISTSPVVHSNQYEYFDKDGNNPSTSSRSSTVLPYSGQQQVSGANSATITYEYNTTKRTSATVKIGNETMVYGTWSEFLADNSCGGIM